LFTRLLRTVLAVALLSASAGASRADEVVLLSSLDLSKSTQGWGAPKADKSVEGHPITLAGKVYEHGFGTHAPGLLAIDLKGAATEFRATVGIDDDAIAGKGSAEFQVLDPHHKVLWTSGIMRRGDAAKPVNVDVRGLASITLRVTTAGDGSDYDHADWADAAIVTSGAHPETTVLAQHDPVIDGALAPDAPHINGPSAVGVFPGTPLIWTVPVTGKRPLSFSVKGLPKGVSFDKSTGIFTGALAKAGDYSVRVRVSNAAGHADATVHLIAGPTLVQTPPMGWNSYDCFGDNVTEAETLANARYIRNVMQPYGWDTVVVDYRWYDPGAHDNNANARAGAELTMDKFGRLLPSPNRFPSAADGVGFKALADQAHAMGLKFGIHIMRGIPRNAVTANLPIEGSAFKAADAARAGDMCGWCPDMYGVSGDTPAGQAYYDSLFRLYAAWGIDYVKMDDTSSWYHTDEIDAVRKSIDRCGRSIVYSLSPGETPFDKAAHVASHANLWRVSGDFWDDWGALSHEFTLGDRWHDIEGPGHWPDADMLPLGHLSVNGRSVGGDRQTRFTKNEQVTLISLWSLLPSPLMVGGNMPDNDEWTRALLTNPEVLALNQDSAKAGARRAAHDDDREIWTRTLADSSVAVGLFNPSDFENDVSAAFAELNLKGRYTTRDLWLRKDLGIANAKITATVPAHGAVLVRLRKCP
jgi:alpha-galactosidase